jgi:uncharacterized RmlC-like cupin family protein
MSAPPWPPPLDAALPPAVFALMAAASARAPLGADATPERFTRPADAPGTAVYAHRNERLGIDFTVERVDFPGMQTLDPRILRIAPGRRNELHRHAHETLFVLLSGEGEVRLGDHVRPMRAGDLAFVPRWLFHQSTNTSETTPLVLLAITDFGFTSAVLGDYDRRTRLAAGGDDSAAGPTEASFASEPAGDAG